MMKTLNQKNECLKKSRLQKVCPSRDTFNARVCYSSSCTHPLPVLLVKDGISYVFVLRQDIERQSR